MCSANNLKLERKQSTVWPATSTGVAFPHSPTKGQKYFKSFPHRRRRSLSSSRTRYYRYDSRSMQWRRVGGPFGQSPKRVGGEWEGLAACCLAPHGCHVASKRIARALLKNSKPVPSSHYPAALYWIFISEEFDPAKTHYGVSGQPSPIDKAMLARVFPALLTLRRGTDFQAIRMSALFGRGASRDARVLPGQRKAQPGPDPRGQDPFVEDSDMADIEEKLQALER
ncbi:hypothetical protein JZ751_019304 [Albula glossodonta]|uniref:Uncharacterized protein n=1 Tax=Albula glossodonta TaxID=121402 RepID=A0A8T2MZ81_9TELE|nr:hypothetical protein JZ751_019304 [Albula glossodonta]